jgi:L-fucose isomerase-like protein
MTAYRIAFIPLARTTFDIPLAEMVTKRMRQVLQTAGFQLVGPDHLVTDLPAAQSLAREIADESCDILFIFQATFADSTMVTAITEANDAPVFLWAIPEEPTGSRLRLNSFCGINLAGHALTLRKIPYEYAYAYPENAEALEKVKVLAAAGYTRRRLKTARLGVVGEHPAGMDTCHLDEAELQRLFGLTTVHIPLERVFSRARAVEPAAISSVRQRLDARLPNLAELEQKPLAGTLSVYTVLQEMVKEEKLDGLAVRCWPEFFTDLGCAACGAMSMLTDELTPCSCEADANGTVTQLILQWINNNQHAFGSDFVAADVEKNTGVLWHCGLAPLSMANPKDQPRGTIHSNRRVPLLMEFTLKPGPVTLARLNQSTGQLRMVVGRGEMLSAPPSFSGTSGVIRFECPVQAVLDTMMNEGFEHHVSLTYGDHYQSLLAFAKFVHIPVFTL